MQITVTIPDELAAQVQSKGLALETYVLNLVKETLSQQGADASRRRGAVEAMLHFPDKYGTRLGAVDLKGMVHEGHKY